MSDLDRINQEALETARTREERLRNIGRLSAWRERYRKSQGRHPCQKNGTTASH